MQKRIIRKIKSGVPLSDRETHYFIQNMEHAIMKALAVIVELFTDIGQDIVKCARMVSEIQEE